VLRGIFLVRQAEIDWFYQGGCNQLFPDAWEDYLAAIPPAEHGDLLSAYYRRLTSDDPEVRLPAARAWSVWEARTSRLLVSEELIRRHDDGWFAEAFARIECHYFKHRCWFVRDDELLAGAGRLRHIPGAIVQGRYDVVCPMRSAWDLHRAWPEAELHVIADAGHSAFEDGIALRLLEVTDRFATLLGG
jgi:proline iminopeptidase